MTKYNRPNGKLFGSSANNIGVFGSGQTGETPTTSTDPNAINTLNTHWEDGWNGAVVSQAPYTAPFIEDMNAVNYVNSYNSAYLLQRGIPEYDSNEEYQTDSVCTYNGEIWICLQDSTTNITPTEGTYWHLQGEVPVMQDNEVLVGDTGNGATVTDTLNQGDILATTSGLDIKAGVVTNTHISSQAGDKIAESKVNLTYSTSTLNTNIRNVSNALTTHTSDTSNPHQTTIFNLDDTNISGSLAGDDTLVYDGVNSEWINLPNTVDNLKNVTITSIAQGDTLSYDGTKWVNKEDSLDNLTDTTITSASSGDALTFNGTKWVNTENSIDNLTDTTITSASSGDALTYDGSKWVNQENSVENLTDTTITSASSGDALTYDGSKWINQENSIDNLTDTTITSASSGDALTYDGSKWINQANSIDNLTDTNITSVQDGETLLYDGNSSKWVNSAVPGGALSSLTDVNLGTLANKELLQYDYANSKWVNSSDVWSRIQINEPYSLWSSASNLTLTKDSPRYRLFTTTSGITVTLPSTGVSAGTTFKFVWTDTGASTLFATPFTFNASNGSTKVRAHNGLAIYEFVALVNTPTTSNDWTFISHARTSGRAGGSDSWSRDLAANILKNTSSGTLVTLSAGVWRLTCIFAYMGGSRTDSYSSSWRTSLRYSGTSNPIQASSGDYLGVAFGTQIPYVKGENYTLGNVSVWSGSLGSVCKTGICTLTNKRSIIAYDSAYSTVAATGAYISARVDAQFIAPYVSALAT